MNFFVARKDCNFDIVVVGACICDLQTYVTKFPKPGETVFGRKFQMDFGGKGANTCVMAAKLGAKTSMVSVVGDDVFGRETLENFRKLSVNTECLRVTDDAATGMTNCIVNESGEPSYISIPAVSKLLTCEHVDNAKHVIQQSKVLVTNNGILAATALESLKFGREFGCITIYNPAPLASKVELPYELYKYTDVLMLNLNEAVALTNLEVTVATTGGNKACQWFHKKGVRCVILTMGDAGAIVSLDQFGKCDEEGRESFHVLAPKAHVVDTTGAGDSLSGAFAFYLSCYPHLSLREITERSVAIATRTVETEGVQRSYPSRDALPQNLFD